VCFPPLIQRGNSGRPSAMPNYFGFYGIFINLQPWGDSCRAYVPKSCLASTVATVTSTANTVVRF